MTDKPLAEMEQSDALARLLHSDPMIGPELPAWLCEAIARKVLGWGFTRVTPPGSRSGGDDRG